MLTKSSRITHNAGACPLLKLPIEVQQNVFTKLLGDHDIQIKPKYTDLDIQIKPKYSHNKSRPFVAQGDLPSGAMSALGACRQIYIIANPVFWSTNTFCFDAPRTFTKWLKMRTAYQKRSLRSIELTQDLDEYDASQMLILRALDIEYLTGLRNLHLTIHLSMWGFILEECKKKYGSIDQMFRHSMQGSDNLAMLPLKTVEITMNARFQGSDLGGYYRPWNQDEVDEFVGMVKRMLLDTDPAGTEARLEAERREHGPSESPMGP